MVLLMAVVPAIGEAFAFSMAIRVICGVLRTDVDEQSSSQAENPATLANPANVGTLMLVPGTN